jgi:hypothetical protein
MKFLLVLSSYLLKYFVAQRSFGLGLQSESPLWNSVALPQFDSNPNAFSNNNMFTNRIPTFSNNQVRQSSRFSNKMFSNRISPVTNTLQNGPFITPENNNPFIQPSSSTNDEFVGSDTFSDGDDIYPETPLDNDAVREARALLLRTPCYPAVSDIYGLSSEQLSAIQVVHAAFITRPLIVRHRGWHTSNSIGGTRGRGSGTILLGMHSIMLYNFEAFVGPGWKLPPWDGSRPFPSELFLDPRFASLDPQHTRNTNPQYNEPILFSAPAGNGNSLLDFTTLDDVGRAYGLQNHAGLHFAMLQPMEDSSVSPSDPAFYFWHAQIQREVEERWMTSINGRNWCLENPNHPFLTDRTDFTLFDSPNNYLSEGACGNSPRPGSSPICAWLESMQQLVNPTLS